MNVRLEPADIFFTRGRDIFSRLIRFFTRQIGEKRTKANHVGIVVDGGLVDEVYVVEALIKVRRHRLMDQYGKKSDEIAVFRPLNLSKEEIDKVVSKAVYYVNKPYGPFKLMLHFLDWLLLGVYFFRRLAVNDDYPICSWVVAHAYLAAGKKFGVEPGAASPDDIWDFVYESPKNRDKYKFVWQRGSMVKTPTGQDK